MTVIVLRGDARNLPLPDASIDLIVTSPPYFGLRSYTDGGEHYDGQVGSEATPAEWLAALVACTAEWVRVLKPSGSIFVNLGDKYSGVNPASYRRHTQPLNCFGRTGVTGSSLLPATAESEHNADHRPDFGGVPAKSLLGLPWRYAIAATDQLGLILRRDIIWNKPNGLPESVTDRCRSSHEYVFHLVKQPRYYAAVDEIREDYQPSTLTRNLAGRKPHTPTGYADVSRGVLRDSRPAGHEANPLGKLPGSVWDIPSQPLTVPAHLGIDHFAAFPMELPRRIILGWSPPGVCTRCGEGRRPVADVRKTYAPRPGLVTALTNAHGPDGREGARSSSLVTITGYACACPEPDAPTRPAVVLDPFGGTGTTATVASVLGRTGITVDRSADYCRLAKWRTQDPGERCRVIGAPKPPPVAEGQAALFA